MAVISFILSFILSQWVIAAKHPKTADVYLTRPPMVTSLPFTCNYQIKRSELVIWANNIIMIMIKYTVRSSGKCKKDLPLPPI